MELLLGLALMLFGIEAGTHVSAVIHDHRIGDLSASQYTAIHQMRDKTFRRVMPVLGLGTFGVVLVSTALALAPGTPRMIGMVATVLMAIDIVLTVTRQMPINRQIQAWTEATIPADWAGVRDRWTFQHNLRTVLRSRRTLVFSPLRC